MLVPPPTYAGNFVATAMVFTVNLSWLTGSVPTPPAMNAECALRRVEFGAAKRSPAADITPGN